MESTIVSFLNGLSSKVFWFAAVVFVFLNGSAIVVFAMTRSRRLVDEWTGKLIATDAALVAVGLGAPLVTGLAKIGVHALASLFSGSSPAR